MRRPPAAGEFRTRQAGQAEHPVRPVGVLQPVAQVITRLILGGAQETVLDMAEPCPELADFPAIVLTGLETGSEGSLWEEAARRGIAVEPAPPLVRRVAPWRDRAALRWLTMRLLTGWTGPDGRTRPFALVHTHSSKAGILGRAAARRAGVPRRVHTVHGWPFHEGQRRWVQDLYRRLERHAARHTDRLVCVSHRDVETGLAAGIGSPGQYVVIRSGIALDRFRPDPEARRRIRAELGIPGDALVVGTIGRFSAQKAPGLLADVLARVLLARREVWAVAVGDGPLRPEFEGALRASGIRDRVRLPGLRSDAPAFFAALDVFVLTSLWEGLPRTLPQAMATGLPVVATRIPGNAEAVREGREGLLFDPLDAAAGAQRVLQLAGSPELRRSLGEAGKARAREFGRERMIAGIRELYRELTAPSRTG